MSAQILIVDDSVHLRQAIRACIEQNADWSICGEAENGRVAVDMVRKLSPDVVILDLAMPVMNGLEAARYITVIAPQARLVLFTMHASNQLLKEAKALGFCDVLSKAEGGTERLLACLTALLSPPNLD
ncbi:MAG TPA: response regulator transcription factor [Candidatus Acidoferrum sp.]